MVVARADKVYRTALKLYIAFVAFVTVWLGVYNVHERSDWAMADWLINYSGGFVRRGFIGQIALYAARMHVSPFFFMLLLQLGLYAVVLYVVLSLTKNFEWDLSSLALVYSPATLGFAINDPSFAYRKEILFFALLGVTLLVLRSRRWSDLGLATFLTISATVCILSHEALFAFFPYLFCALLVGFRSVGRAARVAAVPAIAVMVSFALVSRFPGNIGMSRTICASLGSSLTDPPSGFCGGAIAYLGHDASYAHSQVLLLLQSRHDMLHFSLVAVLAFIPVVAMIIMLWRREQHFAAAALVACALVSIAASVPLFIYGTDWTRWVYIHVFSLFLLLLFVVHELPATRVVALGERPRSTVMSVASASLLLLYVFGWNLSTYQPRIPFGGLVHFVMHQHWRSTSVSPS